MNVDFLFYTLTVIQAVISRQLWIYLSIYIDMSVCSENLQHPESFAVVQFGVITLCLPRFTLPGFLLPAPVPVPDPVYVAGVPAADACACTAATCA